MMRARKLLMLLPLVLLAAVCLSCGLTAEAQLPGSISGVVTDAQEDPLEGCSVISYAEDKEEVYRATNEFGSYTIADLAPQEYLVAAQCDGYVSEYYEGVRWANDATLVPVAEGEDTPDIDFSLDVGGTISGVVTDAQLNPLENCSVHAIPEREEVGTYGDASTNSAGYYTLVSLTNE